MTRTPAPPAGGRPPRSRIARVDRDRPGRALPPPPPALATRPARGALGAHLHLALDRRLLRLHALPMIATLAFTFTNINLPRPSRSGSSASTTTWRSSTTPRRGSRSATRSSSRPSPSRSRSSRRSSWPCSSAVRDSGVRRRLPRAVVPAVRRAVRGRRHHLAVDAQRRQRLAQPVPPAASASRTRPTGSTTPTWIYPGLVLVGLWGIGGGMIVYLAGLRGIPTELYDAARIDGAGVVGAAPPRDPADAVAGRLLHADPVGRRRPPVLPRAARPQPGHRRAGRHDALPQPLHLQELLRLPGHVVRGDARLAPVRRSRS